MCAGLCRGLSEALGGRRQRGGEASGRAAGPAQLGEPHLHRGCLVAVVVPSPRPPVDTIGIARVRPPEVAAVQVGRVTTVVPPGPLVLHGTVRGTLVVVLVFGGEEMVFVGRQGITCSGGRAGVARARGSTPCHLPSATSL